VVALRDGSKPVHVGRDGEMRRRGDEEIDIISSSPLLIFPSPAKRRNHAWIGL